MSPKTLFSVLLLFFIVTFGCGTHTEEQKTEESQKGILLHGNEGVEFFSWSPDRIPLVSAHRGGPYPGYPENAIETFEHIASQIPIIIECDIAMTQDSVLVMMHDYTLDRTTDGTGRVSEVDFDYIKTLNLVDMEGTATEFKVPTLREVLHWAKDKAILTLDVKRGVPFQKVIRLVEELEAQEYAAVITYNATDAALVHELNQDLMISVSLGSMDSYQAHADQGIPDERMIVFVGVSEPEPEWYEFLHQKGITCILGVLGNLDNKAQTQGDSLYADFIKRGADILATDRPLEAHKVIQALQPEKSKNEKYIYGY